MASASFFTGRCRVAWGRWSSSTQSRCGPTAPLGSTSGSSLACTRDDLPEPLLPSDLQPALALVFPIAEAFGVASCLITEALQCVEALRGAARRTGWACCRLKSAEDRGMDSLRRAGRRRSRLAGFHGVEGGSAGSSGPPFQRAAWNRLRNAGSASRAASATGQERLVGGRCREWGLRCRAMATSIRPLTQRLTPSRPTSTTKAPHAHCLLQALQPAVSAMQGVVLED